MTIAEMDTAHVAALVGELQVQPRQVSAALELLFDGATVPFIARYRKEVTGSLDETVITQIRDRYEQLLVLDRRREAILKSLIEQGKLSEDLELQIRSAPSLAQLEDLYLPFRPKRRTRASIARKKGLEPLASLLWEQNPATDPSSSSRDFIDVEKGVENAEAALSGARDIIAEWVNEHAEARSRLRELFAEKALIRSCVASGKEEEGSQYRDYHEWEESLAGCPAHRYLAMRRGEKEGMLSLRVLPEEDAALTILDRLFVKGDTPASRQVRDAVRDSYGRLLAPSLENEARQNKREWADREAIRVFADNLRHLLMAAPLGFKRVMAVDPGFRTGCKVVCLDPQGKLLHHEAVFPHSGDKAAEAAARRMRELVRTFEIEAVAIGNGTAGRETEVFIKGIGLPSALQIVMVDESGASVYSASPVAREEFPDHDVTVRGAVSIGRRLMDPLAELVKIEPKSLGVGQYQHDVDQGELKKGLDDVVMSCVNGVGVEVNTASAQLLTYVSGLGTQTAKNIVARREGEGPFKSRKELLKVPRLGPKAFQQAAGFLRIRDAANPLDGSAVHPESYSVVETMAKDMKCTVADLMTDSNLRDRIKLQRYITPERGLPTLTDILQELAQPGRDPRQTFEAFSFAEGIEKMEDLYPGMKLPGIVTNVTAFGAFVDIGVHRDGLVHVSELSDGFVSDPLQVIRVHQKVMVVVLDVDLKRKRISLSMKSSPGKGKGENPPRKVEETPRSSQKSGKKQNGTVRKPTFFNNPFQDLLKKNH